MRSAGDLTFKEAWAERAELAKGPGKNRRTARYLELTTHINKLFRAGKPNENSGWPNWRHELAKWIFLDMEGVEMPSALWSALRDAVEEIERLRARLSTCKFCGQEVAEGVGGHTSGCYERMLNKIKEVSDE